MHVCIILFYFLFVVSYLGSSIIGDDSIPTSDKLADFMEQLQTVLSSMSNYLCFIAYGQVESRASDEGNPCCCAVAIAVAGADFTYTYPQFLDVCFIYTTQLILRYFYV